MIIHTFHPRSSLHFTSLHFTSLHFTSLTIFLSPEIVDISSLTHCAARQTDIEPRYPGPDSTLQSFGSPSVTWYTTVTPAK